MHAGKNFLYICLMCCFVGDSSFGDGDTKGQSHYENMQITSVLQPYPCEKDLDNLTTLGSQQQNTGIVQIVLQ